MNLALAFENQVEVGISSQINNGFTIMPNQIWGKFEEFNLSYGSMTLYTKVVSMCYGKNRFCFPSQSFLAKSLHCSTRQIQRWLKELVAAGLISVRHRTNRSNIYNIIEINNAEKLSTVDTNEVPLEPEVCDMDVVQVATPVSDIKKTILRNTNHVCMPRDTDDVLDIIRVLGDHGIDIDSPRGQQYEKLYLQEKATPEQLRIALHVVSEKIKQCSVRNEFGLAVSSIRQQKAHIELVQPINYNSNQNFGEKTSEGKRAEFKSNAKKARKDKYEKFYL